MHRQANRALERLRNPAGGLPPQRLAGLQLDTAALADELQPATDQLTQALADVDRELRETETSLGLKTEAMEAFDRAVRGVGRIIKGCDELAEYPNFAEKIRLSRSRRGGVGGAPNEEDLPPSEQPEAEPPPEGEEEVSTGPPVVGFTLSGGGEPPDSSTE